MATNINPVLQFLQQRNADQLNAGQLQASNVGDAEQQGLIAEQKSAEAARLAHDAEQQKLQAILNAQNDTTITQAAFGGKLGDPNELIGQLAQSFRENTAVVLDQAKKIQQMDSVEFSDNPLQWLQNQFTINSEIDKHNAAQGAADSAANAMRTINDVTSSTAAANLAAAKTLSSESVAAQLQQHLAESGAALAQLKQQNLRANSADIHALQQGQQQVLSNMFQGISLEMQAGAERRAEGSYAMSQEEHQLRMQALNESINAKDSSAEGEQNALSTLNAGLAAHNKPPITSMKEFKAMIANPEIKAAMAPFWVAGQGRVTTGRVYIGADPGDAALNIKKAKSDWSDNSARSVTEYLDGLVSKAATVAAGVTNAKDRENTIYNAINTFAATDTKHWVNDTEHKDSIYQAPDLASLAELSPDIKQLKLYKSVLEPLIGAGANAITAAGIHEATLAAIKSGAIPSQVAFKEVPKLFQSIKNFNNTYRMYDAFGLPPQTTYTVKVVSHIPFIADRQFDISKPEEFVKYSLYSQNLKQATKGSVFSLFGGQ